MILFLLISVLAAQIHSSAVPARKQVRSGRFIAFDADDMFLDLLDEMQDPLPDPHVSSHTEDPPSESDNGLKISTVKAKPSKKNETKIIKAPVKDEKIALYNQNTGKFEIVPASAGHVGLPAKPVTENGMFFYGGQHYQYGKPGHPTAPQSGNKTEEIKIFWSSVGDAIESMPFLPIQINVPDMISAMATFLSNSIPFINRFQNPNQPRPSYQQLTLLDPNNNTDYPYVPIVDDPHVNNNVVEDRELKGGNIPKETKIEKRAKVEVKDKPKEKSKEKPTTKRIFKRPLLRITTAAPEDLKIWHPQPAETTKIKNMPITRKKFHVSDREMFNFKNSDISNSPIMILNMPSRPMMYYKLKHNQQALTERPGQQTTEKPVTTYAPVPAKRRRKLKRNSKTNPRKSTKKGKSVQ